MMNNTTNNKRIAKNTMMLYVRMLVLMVISLFTSRVVLDILGVDDFGIYNLVGGIIVLFSFINSAMVSSTQRYLNYEMGQGNEEGLRKVFSMSLNCHLLIILAVIVLGETIGLWFLNTYLNIPEDRMVAANWIYQFSIFSACLGIFYSPYNAAIIAYENMSIYAYVSIIEAILKLVIVYVIVVFSFDKLILYGILMLLVNAIVTIIYVVYCIKKFTICHYLRFWDKGVFKDLMSFSGWSLFGSLANLGASQGINIILNLFWSVAINAAMGIANQVNSAIYRFVSSFTLAYNPQIVKSYSSGEREEFLLLIFRMSRFTYYLMLVLCVPVLICCKDILNIWLVEVPEHAVQFCQLAICFSMIDAMAAPAYMAIQAQGNIKVYQIWLSIYRLGVLPIIALVLFWGGCPELALLINVIMNLVVHIYRMHYLKGLIDLDLHKYWQEVVWPIIMVTSISLPIPILVYHFTTGYLWLVVVLFITIITTCSSVLFVGMKTSERERVLYYIFKRLHYNEHQR